ncbi:hypothetical protein J6590_027620 [Homalodisca vitripennis]|nr:hypothetical protein J6590_027620 [Homalodisca vitripennis]
MLIYVISESLLIYIWTRSQKTHHDRDRVFSRHSRDQQAPRQETGVINKLVEISTGTGLEYSLSSLVLRHSSAGDRSDQQARGDKYWNWSRVFSASVVPQLGRRPRVTNKLVEMYWNWSRLVLRHSSAGDRVINKLVEISTGTGLEYSLSSLVLRHSSAGDWSDQ